MGAALAWACVRSGYRVHAICGPSEAALPRGIQLTRVETAADMATHALAAWGSSDIFISAAAVLDWDVANPQPGKIKKERGELPQLEFVKNLDILAEVAKRRRADQFVLGFAAETHQALVNGLSKLVAKDCDAIFINDVSQATLGFESASNAGWWISRGLTHAYSLAPAAKTQLADTLLTLIEGRSPPSGSALELDLARAPLHSPVREPHAPGN